MFCEHPVPYQLHLEKCEKRKIKCKTTTKQYSDELQINEK